MKELLIDKRIQGLVEEYMPKVEVLNQLVNFYTVFSDLTRLKIITVLSISEMCVGDISAILKINQTTVSHQLRLLKNLNVVKTKRQGKVIFYSLSNDTVGDILLKGVEFLGF